MSAAIDEQSFLLFGSSSGCPVVSCTLLRKTYPQGPDFQGSTSSNY